MKLAGLLPLANELTGTIATDQQRAEVLALPLVMVLLFFVFGGVVAAFLPGIIGGLTIAGALGIMRLTAISVPVHYFAQPVVTLIGLGIAIDYGLVRGQPIPRGDRRGTTTPKPRSGAPW